VAFVPFVVLLTVTRNFYAATVLSVPFLVFGARVERDGDWSSPRRTTTLFLVSALTIIAGIATDGLVVLAFIVAPVVGLLVWVAAGPGGTASESKVVVREGRVFKIR
jgi:hypothetical protein